MQACLQTFKCTSTLNRLAWAAVSTVQAEGTANASERSWKMESKELISFGCVVLLKHTLEQGKKADKQALARAMLASCKTAQVSCNLPDLTCCERVLLVRSTV
jgi:hypothetical protein